MANPQFIAVVLVLSIASAYVVRRAWLRLRSVATPNKLNASTCATACAGCGPAKAPTLKFDAEARTK